MVTYNRVFLLVKKDSESKITYKVNFWCFLETIVIVDVSSDCRLDLLLVPNKGL